MPLNLLSPVPFICYLCHCSKYVAVAEDLNCHIFRAAHSEHTQNTLKNKFRTHSEHIQNTLSSINVHVVIQESFLCLAFIECLFNNVCRIPINTSYHSADHYAMNGIVTVIATVITVVITIVIHMPVIRTVVIFVITTVITTDIIIVLPMSLNSI